MKACVILTFSFLVLPSYSMQIKEELLSYNPVQQINQKLLNAASSGDFERVKWWLAAGADINYQEPAKHAYTPLLAASFDARTEICKFLIENKANVNVTDNRGNTPLMYTVKAKGLFAFNALLDAGADPNRINKKGNSALIWASHYFMHPPAVDILLPRALYVPPIEKVKKSRMRILSTLLYFNKSYIKDVILLIISYLGSDVARLVVTNMDHRSKFPAILLVRAQRELTRLTIKQIKAQLRKASENRALSRDPLLNAETFEEKYREIIREGITKRFTQKSE